jgi:fucose permease
MPRRRTLERQMTKLSCLSFLDSANTYVCILAGQQHASLALTFAQGFNGISAFTGPVCIAHVPLSRSQLIFFLGSSSLLAGVRPLFLPIR